MAEEAEETQAARRGKAAAKKKAAARAPRAGVTGGLALILATIAAIGAGYLWYELLYERQDLIRTDVVGRLARNEAATAEVGKRLTEIDSDLALLRENQDTIRTGLDKIQNELARNRTEWVLAEAERLLTIANHRLQLARDVPSALSALRAADRQLNLIANPNLLPIRREIAREIGLLEGIEKTDVTGLSLQLANLAETVDRLPVRAASRPAEAEKTPRPAQPREPKDTWRAAARGVWSDLLALVRIRRDSEVRLPLLPPEQQYFLRENLRLMLYGAQQAILQGNATLYRQNLQTARRWIEEHFDPQTQVIISLRTELDSLVAARIAGELPNISGSLELLRRLPGRKAAS